MFKNDEYEFTQKFFDRKYIYKSIIISKNIVKFMKKKKILYKKLTNLDLENLGIYNKNIWENYINFKNDPYTIFLRRKITNHDHEELQLIRNNNILMKISNI